MMKKIFLMMSALLTAIVLSVGLTACGDDGDHQAEITLLYDT